VPPLTVSLLVWSVDHRQVLGFHPGFDVVSGVFLGALLEADMRIVELGWILAHYVAYVAVPDDLVTATRHLNRCLCCDLSHAFSPWLQTVGNWDLLKNYNTLK